MQYLIARVLASDAALELIRTLRQKHGALVFLQSDCCDGNTPMCFPTEDFNLSAADIYLGNLDGVPFYMGTEQFEYWKHTQLVIDVESGNGSMSSLESGTGKRFLLHSCLLSDEKNTVVSGRK